METPFQSELQLPHRTWHTVIAFGWYISKSFHSEKGKVKLTGSASIHMVSASTASQTSSDRRSHHCRSSLGEPDFQPLDFERNLLGGRPKTKVTNSTGTQAPRSIVSMWPWTNCKMSTGPYTAQILTWSKFSPQAWGPPKALASSANSKLIEKEGVWAAVYCSKRIEPESFTSQDLPQWLVAFLPWFVYIRVSIKMCYLLKYSMLKPGLRLAAWEGDASKAGRMNTALSGQFGRAAADEEANKEGSRVTALCRRGEGSQTERVEKRTSGAETWSTSFASGFIFLPDNFRPRKVNEK